MQIVNHVYQTFWGWLVIVRSCLLFLFLVMAGCASAPDELSDDIVAVPELADDVSSVENDARFARKSPSISVPDDTAFNFWWRYTGNKELEWLIDRAITNSQLLQIAAQRVVQAKARALQAGASSMPSLTATAGYSAEGPEGGLGTVPVGGNVKTSEELEIGLSGRYSPDLWGQNASLANSAQLKLKQAVFQYDARLLELVSQISKRYFQYLSLNDRIRNTKETEKVLTSMLLGMEDRYDQGDATVVEVQIQRSAVYNSKVRLPTLLKDRDKLVFELARLIGVAPGGLHLTEDGLNSISFPSSISNVSTAYVLRRPDIRAIESGMLAADADLDVARKALLPGLTLAADLSTGSGNPADLFQPNTLIWSALATLSATIFDGGSLEQEVRYAQAVRNELVESYVDTVMNGLLAARSAVTELEYSGERLDMQRESAKAAKIAQDFGFESYSVGGIDFLTYLDSMQSYQDRQDSLYQLELEYYQAYVDFYSALGGGIPYREISQEQAVYQQKPDAADADILSPETVVKRRYLQTGWLNDPEPLTDDPWLVKLTGVYDYFAIDALLRDLPRRYETLKPADRVLVEKIGVSLGKDDERPKVTDAVWYSVNFAGFSNKAEAQNWCQQLRKQQQRCVVYSPEENFEYVALFDVDEVERRSYDEGESILAKRHAAEREAEKATLRNSDGIALGRLYSLLKIEGSSAWLIGNRSHRIWRFDVGDRLAYEGKLKSVNPNRAIVSFDRRDYLLRPIYRVEGVEEGAQGRLFARLRWGGPSGQVYYHREGDRLYGKGIIESITKNSIQVRWAGQLISLPVME